MDEITSRDNPRIKRARRIREGKEQGFIFVEGARLADEALRSRLTIVEAFLSAAFLRRPEYSSLTARLENSTSCFQVPDKVADALADTKNSQGIFLVCERPMTREGAFEVGELAVFVYLHEINNPSNLGAILRTAEAAGVEGVFVGPNSADPFSPKSLRASMGSAFRLSIKEGADLEQALKWAASHGVRTTAADINGSGVYTRTDWTRARLVIFGSEAEGLPAAILSKIDDVVRIPLENGVESLNLAVSAAVILFEALRQRRAD
jgi:TrmH family RNA methyltransferase